jgi:acetolactate synthase-1/2/3 large subunit
MNGAEHLIETAVAAGLDVCLMNPGTTELHLVAAMDRVPGMRTVLGVFEGVCTGAADGYGRMAEKPALTLLHLGPGLANGIACLHNAQRARTPIVNLVGDHATRHVDHDPPLAADIDALAGAVSSWVKRPSSADRLAQDLVDAVAAASRPPGRIATLIIPADCSWGATTDSALVTPPAEAPGFSSAAVQAAARVLQSETRSVLLLGGHGLREKGLRAAARIASISSCLLYGEGFTARFERGAGWPLVSKLPYFPEEVLECFQGVDHLVLAGAREPVAFFGYPNQPSRLVPAHCRIDCLAAPDDDVAGALESLADELGGTEGAGAVAPLKRTERPVGRLTPESIAAAVTAVQPGRAIVMDEAATSRGPYVSMASTCPPHTYMMSVGGAIGHGLPCATGAALACPDRPVLALTADGCGLYTVQALWTQAREGLNVTTLIFSNRMYRILRLELARAGIDPPGKQASAMTSLTDPPLDWVKVAQGFGVPAARADRAEDLVRELDRAFQEPGPHLIEAVMAR